MFISTWTTAVLLMAFVVLSAEVNEAEEQSNRSAWVGVELNLDYGHNSSETSCEAPGQPVNGGYKSDNGVNGNKYSTGVTIQYYCNRGHQLIGQANRTCNGTPNGWQPEEEPYCEPEYIGQLMRRLSGIEDQMRAIEQRITSVEKNTNIGHNISAKMTAVNNKVSAIFNMRLYNWLEDEGKESHIANCIAGTKVTDEDTVSKCTKMELGVRNGHNVSVYRWVIKDFNSKVPKSRLDVREYYCPPFYQTVPGYKFRLFTYIYHSYVISPGFYLLPGEYDDQLTWPFSKHYDLTVLLTNGTQVLFKSFSGEQSTCNVTRPTSAPYYGFVSCYTDRPDLNDVMKNQQHILSGDSVVITLYLYN